MSVQQDYFTGVSVCLVLQQVGCPGLGHPLRGLDVPDGLEICCRHHRLSATPGTLHLLQVSPLSQKNFTKTGQSHLCRKPDANWGSSADALTFINAMKSTQELTDAPDHIKNYRPKVLVMTGNRDVTAK